MHILYQIQETAISLNLYGISISTQICPWRNEIIEKQHVHQAKPFSFMGFPMPTKAWEPQVRKTQELSLSVMIPFLPSTNMYSKATPSTTQDCRLEPDSLCECGAATHHSVPWQVTFLSKPENTTITQMITWVNSCDVREEAAT